MKRKSYRVRFASGQGQIELAGIVDRPDDDRKHPVLVFSHCFTCNKDLKSTVRIARALAERGVCVLRFDMTGLGGSQGEFEQSNFTSNIADLRAAIDFASQEFGRADALMGHSFGGAASLAVAAGGHGDWRPSAVITLAAPSDTTHLATLLASMNAEIESSGIGDVEIGGIRWTIRRQMLDDFRQQDLPLLIPRIQCPTLVTHSPADATVSYDHAIRIMSLLQNKQLCSLLTLHGADHLLSAPADIQYVADSVAAFVQRYSIDSIANS